MASHARVAEALTARRGELAARVAEQHFARHPEFVEKWGELGRIRCREDADFHVQYLSHAIRFATPELFTSYVQWTRQMLESRKIPWSDLQANLEILRDELADLEFVAEYIDGAIAAAPLEAQSFLSGTEREPLARAYLTSLLKADRRSAIALIEGSGLPVRELYLHVFQPVQREIGRLWQNNEISVAEEHYCTASTQAMMAQFYPQILSAPRVGRKVVVACVGNELHEIGTRMVADFFEMAGWDGIYIGANTPAAALTELVCRERPQLVALGVTMTYHLNTAKHVIDRLRGDERCANVKVIVGGYVFRQHTELWRTLEVDGCADDAAGAVEVGNALVSAA